jgi:cytochrome c5
VAVGLLGVALVAAVGGVVFAWNEAAAFDASVHRHRAVPATGIVRSTSPEVVARGKQLADSVGGCTASACHGLDLGGGRTMKMGPAAIISAPNVTGAKLAAYSDDDLAGLLRFGVKRDGTSVLMMPVQSFSWLPDADLEAIISWLRTVPPVDRVDGPLDVTVLGKVLDRRGRVVLDVARNVEEKPRDVAPDPAPDASYGRFVSRACTMCHGEHLSGGPIPGAPSSIPVPLNLTPHETGLRDWSYEDFDRVLTTGIRRNGRRLDPFMPTEAFAKYDDVQKRALWAYLRSLPPTPIGER